MRSLKLGMLALVAALIAVLGFMPAKAQSSLPTINALTSVRMGTTLLIEGIPAVVCQERFESGLRSHGTCRELVTVPSIDLVAGRTTEVVRYDDTLYVRVDQSTTWESLKLNIDPRTTLDETLFLGPALIIAFADGVLSELPGATIGGAATRHFQFWSNDEDLNADAGGRVVYDFFVSGQGFIVQDQLDIRGEDETAGGIVSLVRGFSDFNVPVTVTPPPSNQVRPATNKAASKGLSLDVITRFFGLK